MGHARYLPLMLRYLPPQVVVQVNGCDTPTLGAVVDAVSAQASQPLPPTLLARRTCIASLVADYRPARLTEEPLHTPRLPLRGRAFVRPCYLVITPLQELATFVLTMARPEASVRALRALLRKNQKIQDLGDGWSAAGPGMGSRFRK